MSRVLLYEVPVDDQRHWIELNSDPIAVAARHLGFVEFWSIDTGHPRIPVGFRVFGTGQSGVEGDYVGTAITPSGALVWHLFMVRS